MWLEPEGIVGKWVCEKVRTQGGLYLLPSSSLYWAAKIYETLLFTCPGRSTHTCMSRHFLGQDLLGYESQNVACCRSYAWHQWDTLDEIKINSYWCTKTVKVLFTECCGRQMQVGQYPAAQMAWHIAHVTLYLVHITLMPPVSWIPDCLTANARRFILICKCCLISRLRYLALLWSPHRWCIRSR